MRCVRLLLILPFLPTYALGDDDEAPVSFSKEILPILSNKCFVCHGPSTQKQGFLRLDSYASATSDRGGYRAIDPETPDNSAILQRIHSPDDPMPPKEAEKTLTTQERVLLSRWVRQGGDYETHWAFVPPVKNAAHSEIPDVEMIDHLIEAQLARKRLSLAPEAARTTLARRVALVLTGLPPEPELLKSFRADQSAQAYSKLVDRLIESPRYGEHQARYWLDAVRYGDTHGLHLDNRRGIYPYRDWVIRALNENLPMDDFITWQLAGDLLPDPSLQQLVATGFVRMNPSTSEGGAIPAEFQAKNNFDRTETLGTVLLGMTLTCARCHTHKYDPILQTEYYRLLAFFNSTAEHSMDGNAYVYGPVVRAPRDQAAWEEWISLESARDKLLETAEQQINSGDKLAEVLAYAGAGTAWTSSDWKISQPTESDSMPGEDLWREVENLPGTLRQKLPKDDAAVWISFTLTVPRRRTIWLEFAGGAMSKVFCNNTETPIRTSPEKGKLTALIVVGPGSHAIALRMTAARSQPQISVQLSFPWKSLANSQSWQACGVQDRLRMLQDPEGPLASLGLQERARAVISDLSKAEANFTTSLVARDLEKPRATRVLERGEYNRPLGDPLQPGIISVMGAFPDGVPRNRLGLARWLTSANHPLVARVIVNRIWQRVFGAGLVRTPEDFGLQGEQPTHPELLDWLAVRLQQSGWDLKQMIRLMVTSRTFRQSSARRREIDDPENRLWARGPGFRLDAEVLRDIGLWASNTLDSHMGGEGVKPYQPAGMWLAMAHPSSNTKRYVRDQGKRLYRRSIYVYWKRTSPHPMMTLFDAPDRESSCVKRSRTNTPLQSLGLLNETQRIEMARMLAERLLNEASDDKSRLDMLFELLACRAPTQRERAVCGRLLETMRHRYSSSPTDAGALLSIGEAARDQKLDLTDHAAWTQLAITVLASDVAIMLY